MNFINLPFHKQIDDERKQHRTEKRHHIAKRCYTNQKSDGVNPNHAHNNSMKQRSERHADKTCNG